MKTQDTLSREFNKEKVSPVEEIGEEGAGEENDDAEDTRFLIDVLREFLSRCQRARYEHFLIRLASSYVGYRFYLPAFLDFRGRIYRSGILHFHERDLARSLIVFPPDVNNYVENASEEEKLSFAKNRVSTAAAFHFKKFHCYDDALCWFNDQIKSQLDEKEDLCGRRCLSRRMHRQVHIS
ncbi:hypothetical protein V6N11_016326 [Hibiscus sabdariffa]|uniref:DNA-directed RNA polymerase n=1 Tax=Hibiscus sabdariffa TaxID=183260 RepID=A0ABR2TV98_9ROSI